MSNKYSGEMQSCELGQWCFPLLQDNGNRDHWAWPSFWQCHIVLTWPALHTIDNFINVCLEEVKELPVKRGILFCNIAEGSFNHSYVIYGKPPEKNRKKSSQQLWTMGGGQQILVCEPQKSAFFRANFPKNIMSLCIFIMSHLFVYTKYNHLIHSKFQMQGFIYTYFHSK